MKRKQQQASGGRTAAQCPESSELYGNELDIYTINPNMHAHTKRAYTKTKQNEEGGQFANFSLPLSHPVRHSGSVSARRRGLHLYSYIMRRGPSRPLGGSARGAAKHSQLRSKHKFASRLRGRVAQRRPTALVVFVPERRRAVPANIIPLNIFTAAINK